jgi:hypothetical protein
MRNVYEGKRTWKTCVDGRTILKMMLQEMPCRGVDWMHLTRDRDQRRALVNTAMNLHVPQKVGKFLIR